MAMLSEHRSAGEDLTFLTFVNHKRAYHVHKISPFLPKVWNDEVDKSDSYNYIYYVPNCASKGNLKERLEQKSERREDGRQALFLGFKIVIGDIGESKRRYETNQGVEPVWHICQAQ